MRAALLDAGPIVAFLREDDVHHSAAVEAMERCARSGQSLATTWEAVSEAFTLLRTRLRGGGAFTVLDWAWDDGIVLVRSELADHRRCRQVLEVHRDLSLSYADALLLAVAERLEVTEVLTVDGNHFPAVKLAGTTAVSVVR